ncbi:MAG TPA: FHA domain-containing protein [Sandaracinaceae bacterium LLY-WYZ-13_1]|nr:FHA domain-containing protein [Sandaracinaceae bacterium LLY-WYZ-13_1]
MNRFVLKLGDHEILLVPGHYRIGRDPGCEVRIDDESVSRRHASLRVSDERVELTDHGSRNGVRVNGDRVYGSIDLAPGDRLEVGARKLELVEQGPPDSIESVTKPMPKVPREGADSLALLSPREREVFEQLALGRTQREVAEDLGLSVKTVETYRARIGDKLGLRTRADLVQFALQAGVLRAGG